MIKKTNNTAPRLQCKDLATPQVLYLLRLAANDLFNIDTFNAVLFAHYRMTLPPNLILAKWRQLFVLGMLGGSQGCSCGCGSYTELTPAALKYLARHITSAQQLELVLLGKAEILPFD